jgi:hypothetical protein
MYKFGIILLTVVLFNGCTVYENTYIVKNQTNKKIIVNGYAVRWSAKNNIQPLYSETFSILPGSEYRVIKGIGEDL